MKFVGFGPRDQKHPHRHIGNDVVVNDPPDRASPLALPGGPWKDDEIPQPSSSLGEPLVTSDEVDSSACRLKNFVKGKIRGASSAADMTFDVANSVRCLSLFMAPDPDDIVLGGTPEGRALSERSRHLVRAEIVQLELPGRGTQRHDFVVFGEAE